MDPLLALLRATLLLCAGLILPHLRIHWPLWLRLLSRLGAFTALPLLVQAILGSPLQPHFSTDRPGQLLWEQVIEAGWWFAGARFAVGVARLLVVLENRPRETRIISDLVAGVIFVAAGLAIINFVFAVPIRGLLATSGVIAIVLGLALQSTLSDVFSGIAVGLERPYKPGDLLWIEGGIEGHVIQVNWRSTQIATGQNSVAVVPNSVMAKARLVNRSVPTAMRGDTVSLNLDPDAAPERCIAALTAAVRACRSLLATPIPSVACTGLRGDGASYEIGFSVESSEQLSAAHTELFTQIHRHLRYAGIALAVPGIAGNADREPAAARIRSVRRARAGRPRSAGTTFQPEFLSRRRDPDPRGRDAGSAVRAGLRHSGDHQTGPGGTTNRLSLEPGRKHGRDRTDHRHALLGDRDRLDRRNGVPPGQGRHLRRDQGKAGFDAGTRSPGAPRPGSVAAGCRRERSRSSRASGDVPLPAAQLPAPAGQLVPAIAIA